MSLSTKSFSVGVQTPLRVGLPAHLTLFGPLAAHGATVRVVGGGAVHTPLLHVLPAAHTTPQPPQLLLSVFGLTQVEVAPPSRQLPHWRVVGAKQVPQPPVASQLMVPENDVLATPLHTLPASVPSGWVPF